MHPECKDFICRMKASFPAVFAAKHVFEGGSCDINGTVRGWFGSATAYVGCDWRSGARVDVVSFVHEYRDKPDGYFDFVISTEMLEHDMHIEQSIQRMLELLAPGGSILITAAGPGRPPHELYSGVKNFYRNVELVALAKVASGGCFRYCVCEYGPPCDVRLFATGYR